MALAFQRDGGWVIKWRDAVGKWHQKRTDLPTKAQAKRLAADLERQAFRQAQGLEALPSEFEPRTFTDVIDWWWQDYGARMRDRVVGPFIDNHLRPGLGALPARAVTSAAIESFLHEREENLSPRSLNYLRSIIHRMFSVAHKRGMWNGPNPAAGVERRKETKRLPAFLRAEEVPLVLDALDCKWRPMFVCALYTALRKGEVLGLLRTAVDVDEWTITVGRSYEHDTTKGRHADVLPIANALKPYMAAAMKASTQSAYVFPDENGKMRTHVVALERVLRRAMARAGLIDGWKHVCRRKGCGFSVRRQDAESTKCPQCGFRLWPAAIHRKLRFHDLRHTTATLLLKDGVPLATVQRILRHTDPRLTASVYGHLELTDLRAAVNRLPALPVDTQAATEPQGEPDDGTEIRTTGAPRLVRTAANADDREDSRPFEGAEESTGYEPVSSAANHGQSTKVDLGAGGRWFKSSRPDQSKPAEPLSIFG